MRGDIECVGSPRDNRYPAGKSTGAATVTLPLPRTGPPATDGVTCSTPPPPPTSSAVVVVSTWRWRGGAVVACKVVYGAVVACKVVYGAVVACKVVYGAVVACKVVYGVVVAWRWRGGYMMQKIYLIYFSVKHKYTRKRRDPEEECIVYSLIYQYEKVLYRVSND